MPSVPHALGAGSIAWRALAGALALLVAALLTGVHASAHGAAKSTCESQRPPDWPATAVLRWDGPCVDKRATGLGVLRAYEGTRATRVFYGRMSAGQMELGVVELSDGYVAGRFDGGRRVPSDDRNVLIDAFRQASQAASDAAERFRRAGNTASAAHYSNKARQLADQMD